MRTNQIWRTHTRRVRPVVFLLMALLGSLLLWGMAQLSARAQEQTILTAGVAAGGQIRNAAGDEWLFTACAGNAITITMQSDRFTPYLELYAIDGVKPLIEADGEDDSARIDGFVVEDSGSYLLIAAGRRRTDRGAYELSLDTSGSAKQEDVDGLIVPGDTVPGTIRARRMAAWGFRGCAGDVVTIQADSDEFDAYVELYRSGEDDVLVYDDNSGSQQRRGDFGVCPARLRQLHNSGFRGHSAGRGRL